MFVFNHRPFICTDREGELCATEDVKAVKHALCQEEMLHLWDWAITPQSFTPAFVLAHNIAYYYLRLPLHIASLLTWTLKNGMDGQSILQFMFLFHVVNISQFVRKGLTYEWKYFPNSQAGASTQMLTKWSESFFHHSHIVWCYFVTLKLQS